MFVSRKLMQSKGSKYYWKIFINYWMRPLGAKERKILSQFWRKQIRIIQIAKRISDNNSEVT